MGEDSGEKTEEPTPHKLREAREKGQIAKGKEFTGAVLLLVSFFTLKAFAIRMWQQMADFTVFSFEQIPRDFSQTVVQNMLIECLKILFMILTPLLAAVAAAAIFTEVLQTGFLITLEPLKPSLEKLNPIEGVKKFFKLKQFVELAKSLLKMGIVIMIIYYAIKDQFIWILQSQSLGLWKLMEITGGMVMSVVVRVGMFYIAIAFMDYLYQRYEYMKGLKMSMKEIKDEYKKLEGDPLVKQRQRDAARAMSQGRQMGSVPGADVVVTNPTHYAVALQYKPNDTQAPIVIAKGMNLLAKQIIELAELNYVPVVENPPLARALYAQVQPGSQIPAEHFRTVAEVLAFVYSLKKKRKRRQMF